MYRKKTIFILTPGAYHGRISLGINVGKATSFAYFSWPKVVRIVAKNRKLSHPINQCVVSIKTVSWKEAGAIVSFWGSIFYTKPYKKRLEKTPLTALMCITSKAEKIIWHFVENDKGMLLHGRDNVYEAQIIACFECKRKPFLYAQIGNECRHAVTTFCVNHAKTATKPCNVPGLVPGTMKFFSRASRRYMSHQCSTR